MLVLNRRAGESIVVEDGILLGVTRIESKKVWLSVEAPGARHPVHLSASSISPSEARVEIAAPRRARVDGDGVHVELADPGDPLLRSRATLSANRTLEERIFVDDDLVVGIGPMPKGGPCLTLGGALIGQAFAVTVIRHVGSYARIGLDAPGRRVYRRELWDEVVAANRASASDRELPRLLSAARPARSVLT